MTPDMGLVVGIIAVGMLLLAFALYRTRFRQVRIAERIEAFSDQLDD